MYSFLKENYQRSSKNLTSFLTEYYDNDQNQKMSGNSCQSYFELSDMFKSLIQ